MEQAKDEVTELLRRRRHVKPKDEDNFGVASAESVITQFRQVISTVALVMVVVSSIGLLVGGIGVMNIMLVSVTERTREIGVRKAVGARRSDIIWQFLLEAMTVTAAGGIIGILAGWVLSSDHPDVRAQRAFHRAFVERVRGLYGGHQRGTVLRHLAGYESGEAATRSRRCATSRV